MLVAPGLSTGSSLSRRYAGWLALAFTVAALITGLGLAPPDGVQGQAARLLYLHVPAAWTAYLAFTVVVVSVVGYLRTGNLAWDRRAGAAAEIGVVMTALSIAVGSVWGRAVWGVWWTWDPRLVSTAILLLAYCAYLAVRHIDVDAHRNARRSAIVGTASFALIPVVHFSVVWWRSLHQPATLLAPSTHPPMDSVMMVSLLLSVAAFTAAATWLFLHRLSTPSTAALSVGDGLAEVTR